MSQLLANIDPIFTKLILAVGFSAIIGLEREIIIQRTKMPDFGGVRTYSFIGLLGALTGLLGLEYTFAIPIAGFSAIVLLIAIAYHADRIYRKNKIGLTGEITAILSFVLGMLCAFDKIYLALISTVLIISVLSLKQWLHSFAKNLENVEIFATVKFAIIAFIILPFLPNQAFDPWQALNPHKIWMIVVLISGLNFLGYILNKVIGARKGMALTGFIGGFVSSSAVNLSMTQRSREKEVPVQTLVSGTLLAQASALIITAIEIFILNKELFRYTIVPLTLAVILLFVFTLANRGISGKQKLGKKYSVELKSPFTLSQALLFGLIFTSLLFVIKVLNGYVSNMGTYITGALSGALSLDATTVAMTEVAGSTLSYIAASKILMLGVMVSVLQKIIVVITLGSREFAIRISLYLISMAALLVGFSWIA